MPSAREHIEEGVRHERGGALEQALEEYHAAVRESVSPEVEAEAHRRIADVHRALCDWSSALQAAHRSAAIAESAGLPNLHAEALNAEGAIHQSRGDFLAAVPLFERMLSLTQDDRIHGIAHQNLASVAATRGDFAAAEEHFRESFLCFERAAYLRGVAIALTNYAGIALRRGDYELAEDLCRRALEEARSVEDLELIALAMHNYAEALAHRGDITRAEELVSAALGYFSLMENRWRRVECLRLLGDLRLHQGFRDTAVQCYSQALDLAQSIGALLEATQLIERLQRAGTDT